MDNIDTKTGEVLAVRVSLGSLEAYLFLSTVRKKCINRPWYNSWTCRMFKHEQQRFGERNCIEQWFGLLKRRMRGFCNNINVKNINSGIKRLDEWTGSFTVIYNWFVGLS